MNQRNIFLCSVFLVSAVTSVAFADSTSDIEKATLKGTLSGADAYYRDLLLEKSFGVEKSLGGSGEGRSSGSATTATSAVKGKSNRAAKSGDCSTIWRQWSSNANYRKYRRYIKINMNLWITTKAIDGSPTDSLSCLERWHYVSRLEHGGFIYRGSHDNKMAGGQWGRNNEAYLSTHHWQKIRGSNKIKRPTGWVAKHGWLINGNQYQEVTGGLFTHY